MALDIVQRIPNLDEYLNLCLSVSFRGIHPCTRLSYPITLVYIVTVSSAKYFICWRQCSGNAFLGRVAVFLHGIYTAIKYSSSQGIGTLASTRCSSLPISESQ